jgi:hypothetical protein
MRRSNGGDVVVSFLAMVVEDGDIQKEVAVTDWIRNVLTNLNGLEI